MAAGLAAGFAGAAPVTFLENNMVMRAGRDAPRAVKATATASKAMNKTIDRNMFLKKTQKENAKESKQNDQLICF